MIVAILNRVLIILLLLIMLVTLADIVCVKRKVSEDPSMYVCKYGVYLEDDYCSNCAHDQLVWKGDTIYSIENSERFIGDWGICGHSLPIDSQTLKTHFIKHD